MFTPAGGCLRNCFINHIAIRSSYGPVGDTLCDVLQKWSAQLLLLLKKRIIKIVLDWYMKVQQIIFLPLKWINENHNNLWVVYAAPEGQSFIQENNKKEQNVQANLFLTLSSWSCSILHPFLSPATYKLSSEAGILYNKSHVCLCWILSEKVWVGFTL